MYYTPEEAGSLTVYLKAFNALHAQNITKHIHVQNVLTSAVLYALPQDTFINKTVKMNAIVTPLSNSVECLWDFGDGVTPVLPRTTVVSHVYRHPGHYHIQVRVFNCFNLEEYEVNDYDM